MSTYLPDEVQQTAQLRGQADGGGQASLELLPMQQVKREHPHVSDKEIRRRLWRIYEMALAAANRAQSPQRDDPPEISRVGECE